MIVYKTGSTVLMGEHPVLITEILIKSDCHVEYRVVWWDGAIRRQEWVSALEVTGEEKDRCNMGFHGP